MTASVDINMLMEARIHSLRTDPLRLAHRFFTASKGWTDWQDLERPVSQTTQVASEITEAARMLAAFAGAQAGFDTSPTTRLPGLVFEAYQQDGNWFVRSDLDDTFVNNERKKIDRPHFLKGKGVKIDPLVNPPGGVYAPRGDLMENLLAQKTPRDFARELANTVRESPQQVKTQKVRTVEALRGGTLR